MIQIKPVTLRNVLPATAPRPMRLLAAVRVTGLLAALVATVLLATARPAVAQDGPRLDLARPGPQEFIVDRAGLLSPADAGAIQELCSQLQAARATPIMVVTVESTRQYDGCGLSVPVFARTLFNQWGIGQSTRNGQPWNTGVLLLVSKGDRQARIELGAGWGRQYDNQTRRIMDGKIVPQFKSGHYSAGILAGVRALDQLARTAALPVRGSEKAAPPVASTPPPVKVEDDTPPALRTTPNPPTHPSRHAPPAYVSVPHRSQAPVHTFTSSSSIAWLAAPAMVCPVVLFGVFFVGVVVIVLFKIIGGAAPGRGVGWGGGFFRRPRRRGWMFDGDSNSSPFFSHHSSSGLFSGGSSSSHHSSHGGGFSGGGGSSGSFSSGGSSSHSSGGSSGGGGATGSW